MTDKEARESADFAETRAEIAAMLVTGAIYAYAKDGTMDAVYNYLNHLVENSVIKAESKLAIEYLMVGAIKALEAKK